MAQTRPSEELVAAPLPDLILDLGKAVARANAELHKDDSEMRFTIPEAEIEVSVAISATRSTEVGVSGGLQLHAFNVNASYKNTYSFNEEASSHIRIVLKAVPVQAEAATAETP